MPARAQPGPEAGSEAAGAPAPAAGLAEPGGGLHRALGLAGAVLVGGLAVHLLFADLGRAPLQPWDEGVYAGHALEALESGRLIGLYTPDGTVVRGFPRPLPIWSMVLAMKLLGPGELAVRLPSALCALAVVAGLVLFAWRRLRSLFAGAVGGLVLLTSLGFVGSHVAASGDLDAMLVAWTTGYALAWFALVEGWPARRRWLVALFAAFLCMGVLTKWTAAVMPVPGLVLYALWRGRLRQILAWRGTWVGAVAAVSVVAVYLGAMERAEPGVVRYIFIGDGYRLAMPLWGMGKDASPFYYLEELVGRGYVPWATLKEIGRPPELLEQLIVGRFVPWAWLLPPSIAVLMASGRPLLKGVGVLGLCFVACDIVLFSVAQTKAFWYIAAIYPVAALTIGVAADHLLRKLAGELRWAGVAGGLCLLGACVACAPLGPDHRRSVWRPPVDEEGAAEYRDYFERAREVIADRPLVKVVAGGVSDGSAAFYARLARRRGLPLVMSNLFNVEAGDDLLTCHRLVRDTLPRAFDLVELNADGCWLLHVKGWRHERDGPVDPLQRQLAAP